MTPERALEILKANEERNSTTNYLRCKHTAIEALEKQIPKKPVGDLHSVPHYRCPTCKGAVIVFEKDIRYVFCKWCGQALDWSDIE